YSDGEGGPANWRYAKLGPIIGTRTYGALVGSAPAWPLMDGGAIQVPRYGNYREDVGWVVEGPGVYPDIDVDNDPNLWAKGTDAQLDRAVKEMLDQVAKKPIKRPVQPADPVTGKTKGGGG
ncbi:MAG: S41 family peptidase, partial [Fimbriimonadaceae bacterium]